MAKDLKITLKKSGIGKPKKHKLNLQSLGLTKLNKTEMLKDTPENRGKIKKVFHLLEISQEM